MTDRKLSVIRRKYVVIVAVDGKTGVDLFDLSAPQFIGVHVSAAVVHQIPAVLRPIGRFDNMIEFFENFSLSTVYIDRFQNAE